MTLVNLSLVGRFPQVCVLSGIHVSVLKFLGMAEFLHRYNNRYGVVWNGL